MMKNLQMTERMVGIAKDKKLLKEYQSRTVYLNDGDQFQIMLFNPTKSKIGAKIKFNGEQIPNMVVLRPGERIWLDRYLHKNASFIFSTYEVENSETVKEAISNNGKVEVDFFYEQKPRNYIVCDSFNNWYSGNTSTNVNPFKPYSTEITWQSNRICSDSSISTCYYNTDYSTTVGASDIPLTALSSIETGRIEEGGRSDQEFSWDNSDFSINPFKSETLKLLPMSMKTISKNDIQKRYCTNCGRKLNPKFNYCPGCGTKVE